jgi:hypothetical protein
MTSMSQRKKNTHPALNYVLGFAIIVTVQINVFCDLFSQFVYLLIWVRVFHYQWVRSIKVSRIMNRLNLWQELLHFDWASVVNHLLLSFGCCLYERDDETVDATLKVVLTLSSWEEDLFWMVKLTWEIRDVHLPITVACEVIRASSNDQ